MIRIMIDKKHGIKNTGETLCFFELKKVQKTSEYVDDNICYYHDFKSFADNINKYLSENERKSVKINDFLPISEIIENLLKNLNKLPDKYKITKIKQECLLEKMNANGKFSFHRSYMKEKGCIEFVVKKYPMHSNKEITNVSDLVDIYKELEELV